jgi:serine/threonine protein kinase
MSAWRRKMPVELIERIDAGAFGDVWKGRDSLGREVAVKIIRFAGAGVSDALTHAKALARTRHRNIVIVHTVEKIRDPSSDEETDCIVMELIDGMTLLTRLEGDKFTVEHARSFGLQIIDGLQAIR